MYVPPPTLRHIPVDLKLIVFEEINDFIFLFGQQWTPTLVTGDVTHSCMKERTDAGRHSLR
jgi:hypothetical protein